MTLFQIQAELRLLAGELRGHDDLDQWRLLLRLADELEQNRRLIMVRSNRLARRALPFQGLEAVEGFWV